LWSLFSHFTCTEVSWNLILEGSAVFFIKLEWCFGSWVHILSLLWNASLTHFVMSKKFKRKFACTSSHVTCAQSLLLKKSICHLGCAKKRKFGAKNKAFYKACFLHQLCNFFFFFCKTVWTVYRDVHTDFLIKFWQLEIYAFGGGGICTLEAKLNFTNLIRLLGAYAS
jgi:hypothetical protein